MAGGIKKAGGISFGVSMATGKLSKDVAKARKTVGGFVGAVQGSLGKLRASFGGIGSAFTAAFSGAAIVGFVTNQFRAIDALHETSQQLGVTTESLSRLGHAADMTETSQERMIAGFTRLGDATRKAMTGLGTAAGAYAKLGIDAEALNRLSPDKQFQAIAEKVGNLSTHQEQLNAAQAIFGKQLGSELLPLLKLGKEGLAGMAAEADKLGITINSVDAEKVAKAADEIAKLKKQLASLGNEAAIEFGPAVARFGNDVMTGLSQMTGGSAGENRAEEKLRKQTELKQARAAQMTAEVQARMRARKQKEWGDTLWQRAAASNARDKRQGAAFAGIRDNLAGKAGGFLSGLGTTAQQIASGVMTSSAARGQRQSALQDILSKSLFTGGKKATDATWAKTQRKTSPIADFDAARSGSLAAYQQRVRGSQQFSKVEEKQLAVQERIADGIDELVNIMPSWGIA